MAQIDFFGTSSGTRSAVERQAALKSKPESGAFTDDYKAFGWDYFDNPDVVAGYHGYRYDGRYAKAAKKMCGHYGLERGAGVLEVGCAKGFILVEFFKLGMSVEGVDASDYAVKNAHPDIQQKIRRGDVCELPFEDEGFDLVFGKEVLPHVPEKRMVDAVRECMRVSRGNLFFEIQCGRTEREIEDIRQWDPTHMTLHTPDWWDALFRKVGYPGDVHYKILFPEMPTE